MSRLRVKVICKKQDGGVLTADYIDEEFITSISDGVCHECRNLTRTGREIDGCAYTSVVFQTCGYRICDGSC